MSNPFSDSGENPVKQGSQSNLGCWLIVLAVIAAWILFHMSQERLPPSNDPYYDAPTGRTSGGDTY